MKIRVPVSTLPPGVPGFVRWLRVAHPRLHGELAARLRDRGLAGMGLVLPTGVSASAPAVVNAAATQPGVAQQILSTFTELVKVGLPMYQQDKLFKLQLQRAQQNLPPLDTSALADASALRVGVDTQTRNTGLIIGGAVAAAILGFALLRRS